jgi:hypothetical protein
VLHRNNLQKGANGAASKSRKRAKNPSASNGDAPQEAGKPYAAAVDAEIVFRNPALNIPLDFPGFPSFEKTISWDDQNLTPAS